MQKDMCETITIHPDKIEEVKRHLLKEKDHMQLSTLLKVISIRHVSGFFCTRSTRTMCL
jgi:hypothetical protein